VKFVCNREIDAPKAQRLALLLAGVAGALLFTLWPFFAGRTNQLGALAWIGGVVALAVYFLTLKRTSGGLAYDFLQRLARRQRAREAV
jgi:drug/metabolite transporter (DMT)-like permease